MGLSAKIKNKWKNVIRSVISWERVVCVGFGAGIECGFEGNVYIYIWFKSDNTLSRYYSQSVSDRQS